MTNFRLLFSENQFSFSIFVSFGIKPQITLKIPNGSYIMAFNTSKTTSITKPNNLKGNKNNQIIGYKTKANIAKGNDKKAKINHKINVTM